MTRIKEQTKTTGKTIIIIIIARKEETIDKQHIKKIIKPHEKRTTPIEINPTATIKEIEKEML